MWQKSIIVLYCILFFICESAFAQQPIAKEDSTHLYENIKTYSKRNKFTKSIYRLIFKPGVTSSKKKAVKKKVYKKLIQKPYSAFEGKTIRHINIQTLDPFGYSITDTIVNSQNFLSKAGNKLHVKSRPIAIRNLLLFRQNQLFDSLLVKESERLVHSMSYVHDVSFFVKETAKNSDSVDIFIFELDNWSIIPNGAASTSSFNINLADKNFLGLGHEFQDGFAWYQNATNNAYIMNYFIPNIRNTFIKTALHYERDEFRNSIKSFEVDRPFFSPFAKWAAGVLISQKFRKDSIYFPGSGKLPVNFKFNTQDF